MKLGKIKNNDNGDAYSNGNLKPLTSGYSQGVSADKPGSCYTKRYPNLKATGQKPTPDQKRGKL